MFSGLLHISGSAHDGPPLSGAWWSGAAADAVAALSYLTIAVVLVVLVRRRRDLSFGPMLLGLAALVTLCAATHLLSVWAGWNAAFDAVAPVKVATAALSVFTATMLWKLLPHALSIPSPEHLRAANSALQAEIAERLRVEGLLRQAQKLEAVGQLTRGVAHDFNNQLTVVSGNVDLARRALPSGDVDRVQRHLVTAMHGVGQAVALTGRLLAFSQRRVPGRQPTDVNAVIGGMSELLTRALGEGVEVRAVLDDAIGTVDVDRHQLEGVLLDLVIAARDALSDGDIASGSVTIATANRRLGAARSDTASGDHVLIAIEHGGAADARTAAHARLAGIIEEAGGQLLIEALAGEGQTVAIYLPRIDAVSTPATQTDAEGARRARGETVLVVEDDANVRAFVVEALGDLGYLVVDAADAADALNVLATQRPVDVLLTDVVMPRMSGRVLADVARARFPALRVLYMTGYADTAAPKPGRLDPGFATISKPFNVPALANKLREVLDAKVPALRRAS